MLKASDGKVDSWHCTGDKEFHRSEPGQTFIEFCQTHLPQLTTTIKLGPTGYPAYGTSFKEDWGWCLDEIGRFHVITPNHYLFQRMLNGHMMVIAKRNTGDWLPVFSEQLTQIETTWSNLHSN